MYIKYLVGSMHDAISICCLNYEYITLELPVGFSICICRIMNVLSYLVDDLNTVLSIAATAWTRYYRWKTEKNYLLTTICQWMHDANLAPQHFYLSLMEQDKSQAKCHWLLLLSSLQHNKVKLILTLYGEANFKFFTHHN